MRCNKCNKEMIEGVLYNVMYGRPGLKWMPQKEYEKKGLKAITRDIDSFVKVAKVKNGKQIIEEMYYCPCCHIITGEIKEEL